MKRVFVRFITNKNRLLSLGIALGYLMMIFGADALLVRGIRNNKVSVVVADWWLSYRILFFAWSVFIFLFVRTFDKLKVAKRENRRIKCGEEVISSEGADECNR